MSEKEKKNVQEVCDIYKDLPDYLKGKIDGYAEAIKEKKSILSEIKDAMEEVPAELRREAAGAITHDIGVMAKAYNATGKAQENANL